MFVFANILILIVEQLKKMCFKIWKKSHLNGTLPGLFTSLRLRLICFSGQIPFLIAPNMQMETMVLTRITLLKYVLRIDVLLLFIILIWRRRKSLVLLTSEECLTFPSSLLKIYTWKCRDIFNKHLEIITVFREHFTSKILNISLACQKT